MSLLTKQRHWLPSKYGVVRTAMVVTSALMAAVGPAPADTTEHKYLIQARQLEDVGGSERINYSGKLRMLSQRIPAATRNLVAGHEVDLARDMLAGATAEFTKIANALEHGAPDLNINGEEHRRKTLVAITKLNSVWEPFANATVAILNGDHGQAQLDTVLDGNMDLLARAKLLVSEISGEYANPAEMTQADALLVDISGRQRMLTQKMAKEACLLYTDRGTETTASDLSGTAQTFHLSLTALTDGMPEAGILEAPTPEIRDGLDVVWSSWTLVKPKLEKLIAGDQLTDAEQADVFLLLNTALRDMNTVVGMYSNYAKRML